MAMPWLIHGIAMKAHGSAVVLPWEHQIVCGPVACWQSRLLMKQPSSKRSRSSPQPALDPPKCLPPDDLDVRTALVEAHNLFGYRVAIPFWRVVIVAQTCAG